MLLPVQRGLWVYLCRSISMIVRRSRSLVLNSQSWSLSSCCLSWFQPNISSTLPRAPLGHPPLSGFWVLFQTLYLQAFLIPEDKKEKFKALREELLGSPSVPLKSLQRFAKKSLLFSLAIPACKLYLHEVFKAIAVAAKNSKPSVPVQGTLRQEFEEWAFLDHLSGHLPWRSEHHLSVTILMFSDASQRAWGAVLVKDGLSRQIRDYWVDVGDDINILEAKALCIALCSFFLRFEMPELTYGRITSHFKRLGKTAVVRAPQLIKKWKRPTPYSSLEHNVYVFPLLFWWALCFGFLLINTPFYLHHHRASATPSSLLVSVSLGPSISISISI